METVHYNAKELNSWDIFHDISTKTFGFPDWYGRNLNAWIDLMTYLDDSDDSTSSFKVEANDSLVIQIDNCEELSPIQFEIVNAITDCSSFVNYRRIEVGEKPYIFLSYFK